MTTVSKEDKRTRNRRRTSNNNTNNTNNTNTKENRPASRGRRNLKKNDEKLPVPEKPVIGSSNPFFIAVCAPDSYKPAAVAPNTMTTTTGQQRVKPNVFLRSRPRSAAYSNGGDGGGGGGGGGGSGSGSGSGGYSNRFIHHPALQQSRQSDASVSTSAASPSSDAGGYAQNNVISISDLTHFPSLGANTEGLAAVAAAAPVKLNFKEMMTRSASVASPSVASPSVVSPSVVSVASDVRSVTSVASAIIPQKILSSSNIFLAAFQHSVSHDDDYDDNADVVSAGNKRQPELASSVLIDSCDNKYDRLYK